MPPRRPLVIINGVIQQLPAIDTLDAPVSEVDLVNMSNGSAAAMVIGSPVYVSAPNAVLLARANASGTTETLGLIREASVAAAAAGAVQTDGILTATTAQWDAVTGQTGGLTSGSVYFLSATTAGRLTVTAPTAVGEFVARVGRAISTTALDISVAPPILL